MTDISPTARPRLGVGHILGESFGLVLRNFVPLVAIAAIPALAGILLNLGLVGLEAQAALYDPENPDEALRYYAEAAVPMIVSALIGLVLWGLAAAAVTRAAYDAETGRPVAIGRALRAGLRRGGPVALCMILALIPVYLGLALLILPGLWLCAVWFVIVPVIVVERRGTGAFGRSRELTRDYRWPLIGLLCLFTLIVILVSGLVGALSGTLAGSMSTAGFVVVNLLVSAIVSVLIYAVGGAMCALAYARLVEIKEGTGIDSLADIFA